MHSYDIHQEGSLDSTQRRGKVQAVKNSHEQETAPMPSGE